MPVVKHHKPKVSNSLAGSIGSQKLATNKKITLPRVSILEKPLDKDFQRKKSS